MGVVSKAVERRVGHDRIREQGHPILGRPVARYNYRRSQVTLRYYLVDVLRLDGRQGGKPKIIDDQKIGMEILLDLPLPGLIGPRCKKVPEHFDCFDEEDMVSPPAGFVTNGLRKMGLAFM